MIKNVILYKLNIKTVLALLPVLFCCFNATPLSAQTEYKVISDNLITNSTFDTDISGWTSVPANNPENNGWRWDNSPIYGTTLWIDREGKTVALSNTMNLCQGYPKQVKFSFTSSDTGEYEMLVKLGGQLIGTFINSGNLAQSIFTPAEGVTSSIIYTVFPVHYVTDGIIYNKIRHDFTFTIPDYQGASSGEITFEYTRTGVSRTIYLDNVVVYEIIPTPVPTTSHVHMADCDVSTTYDLTTLQPANPKYIYRWFTSTNTSMTNEVPNPTKAGVGNYYLFASATCTGTNNYSFPSTTVMVHPGLNCCQTNVIRDGTFSQTDPSDSPKGYLVPKGDNTNNGGIHWKRNFTDQDKLNHIAPVDGQNVFYMPHNFGWHKAIYQENAQISRWVSKIIEFDIYYDQSSHEDRFQVILSPPPANSVDYIRHDPSTVLTPYVVRLYKNINGWRVDVVRPGINVWVDNQLYNPQNPITYNNAQKYRVKITVPANYAIDGKYAYGGICLQAQSPGLKYVGNISVIAGNPETPSLINTTVNTSCPKGLGDLTPLAMGSNMNNYSPELHYHWFTTNSSEEVRVADPQNVPVGKYYVFAFDPNTRCYSNSGTEVTVIQSCPVIEGTVYHDWDGSANGINNLNPVSNAFLYALLVNPDNNQVVKSIKLTADGKFSFAGATSTSYYVMISNRDVAVGVTAPTAPAYPLGTKATGETVDDVLETGVDADGKSATFTTGSNASSVTVVNFGVNAAPRQDDCTFIDCVTTTTTFKEIVLFSIDDDPNWNNGIGKKVIIKAPTVINGTLAYDGTTITTETTIDAYDPTKLVFTRTDHKQDAKVEFHCAFEDLAGVSVLNLGGQGAAISCEMNALPEVNDQTYTIASGGSFSYIPENGVNGNVLPDGTTYHWIRTTPIGILGNEIGTGTIESGITASLINYTSTDRDVIYTVTATTPLGCSANFTITVTVTSATYSCSDIWYSIGGTPSSMDRTIGIAKDDSPTSNPPTSFSLQGLQTINVNNTYHAASAIAVSRFASGDVYYIPSQGGSSSSSIYLNDMNIGAIEIAQLPTGTSNVSMTFDKFGDLWIIAEVNAEVRLYTLSSEELSTTPLNSLPITSDKWEDVGPVTQLPAGVTVGDIEFNNGGSLYVLMRSGALHIINPLELNNIATPNEVIAVPTYTISETQLTGYNFSGIATISARRSFLISANNGTNSFLLEYNMTDSETEDPRITIVYQGDVIISDLTSCAYLRNFWVGGVSTEWDVQNNWLQKFVPRTGESIEFADGLNNLLNLTAERELHADANSNREAYDIINKTNKALVIPPGTTLTVYGKVGSLVEEQMVSEINPDKIIIQASATDAVGNLLLKNADYLAGTDSLVATVQFYNQAYECSDCGRYQKSWQYFGIPVKSAPNLATLGGALTVNRWDEKILGNKWVKVSVDSLLTAFKGYEITSSSTTLPTDIYSFQGTLNVGNTTLALSKTDDVNYSGMNLIGNSYSAAIDIANGLTFTGDVEETVYLFHTGTRDQWRKLNGSAKSGLASGQYLSVPKHLAGQTADDGTGIALPSIIPSMHAFFVKATGTNTAPSLTIDFSKLKENEKVNDKVWRSTETERQPVAGQADPSLQLPNVVIDVLGLQSADRVWLFQQPGTTQAFDNGWDGEKIIETGLAQIYVAGSDGNSYQVATVSDIEDTRFGFTAEMNGKYTLYLSVSPEVAARNLSLLDTQTGARITLRNGAEYSFTAKEGDNGKRFKITASGTNITLIPDIQPADKEHYIKIYSQRYEGVKVINKSGEDCIIEVYDVTGKLVLKTKIKYNSMETVLNSGSLHRGIYIVKVQGPTKREVKRVLIQ